MMLLSEDALDLVREGAGAFFGRLAGLEDPPIQRVDNDRRREALIEHGQDPAEDLRGRRAIFADISQVNVGQLRSLPKRDDVPGSGLSGIRSTR
jgi:hypothetical protein